jgi:CHAT domain-containing protein/tetratricopeptide (TPR) repeat protein
MRIRFFLICRLLFFFSFFPLYPGIPGDKNLDGHNEKLKDQQFLMDFVLNYREPGSSIVITAMCKEALRKIHEIYKQIDNRSRTKSFYLSLLDSSNYKKMYPYIFYYLADFYGKQSKEKYLVKSLKYSLNLQDRQFALTQLYRFYKLEKTDYLELSYLLKLIEIQKIDGDSTGLETSYYDLGEIYERKRDYLAALEYYFEALKYCGEVKEDRSGYIYLNIAEVFRVLNREVLAKMYLQKALDYTREYKNEDLEVMALSAYSKLYYEEQDYDNALKYINLSLELENQRPKYICAVSSLYQKALILLDLDKMGGHKIDEAMELLKTAVELGLKNREYDNLLPILSEYVEQSIAFDRFGETVLYLEKIDDIYAPYYPYYFFYYYLKALLFEKQGQMEQALQFYQKTTQKLEEYFSGLHYQQYHSFQQKTEGIYSRAIEFYLKMYDHTGNQVYIKKALYFSEIKNSYIYDLVTLKNKAHASLMQEKEKLEEEFFIYNKKYLRWLEEGVHSDSDREELRLCEYKLDSLKRQNEELMAFILESPVTFKKYKFSDFNTRQIRGRLKPGQMIVKYAVLKENIYTFCIDHRSISYWRLEGGTNEILNKVKQLTAPLDDFTEGEVDYLRINYDLQLAYRLYDILVKGIWEFRENIDEIFIIPDRELFKLPFEALVTGFNQEELDPGIVFSEYSSADYLIEKLPVSYSFSLFHFREESKPSKAKKYTITAFGYPELNEKLLRGGQKREAGKLGSWEAKKTDDGRQATVGITFNQKLLRGRPEASRGSFLEKRPPGGQNNLPLFNEIPSSQKEVRNIPLIFGKKKSRIFLKEDFNREMFETYAPLSEILHIATHFINNFQYPQYSALLFSPDKDFGPFYYAHEVFKLDLGNELVVLSACESSEKHLLGLQGLRGMTASFRHAGVGSMIVSMWPVDEHSSRLTSWFYREYKNAVGKSGRAVIPAALRTAKLKLMKQTVSLNNGLRISFAHPFIWANYILYTFK